MVLFDKTVDHIRRKRVHGRKYRLKSRFKTIQLHYENYLLDLEFYIKQLKRFLTILLVCLVAIASYLVHFLFFTKLTPSTAILAFMMFLGHLGSIWTLIYTSSKISTFNQKFALWCLKKIQFFQSNQIPVFNLIENFKYSNISGHLNQRQIGFRLTNDLLIERKTFFEVNHKN